MTRPIRSFTEMLGLLNRGRFTERLDEELTRAIETLEALPREKGSARISIEIAISYQSGRIDIKPAVKSKLPEGASFGDTPFWSYEGGLSVEHPSQMDMFSGPRDATPRKAESAA